MVFVSYKKRGAVSRPLLFDSYILERTHVDGAKFCAVLRILLGLVLDLLALSEGLESVDKNGGEMDEHVVAALVVGYEAVALALVEPLNCSGHDIASKKNFVRMELTKKTRIPL